MGRAAGDLGVMGDAVGGVCGLHAGYRVTDRAALIECGEDSETQPMPQGGLPGKQRGER